MTAEDVLAQISRQTGLQLHYSVDGTLAAIKPIVLLQGCSESSVVTILLTPTGPDRYRLTCAYEIDARPSGSIDGTPAAIGAIKQAEEDMTAIFNRDSITSQLPAEISESDLKKTPAGSYFRSPVLVSTRIHGSWGQALVLMLRHQDHYTIGFYLQADGVWRIVERPVEISGTKDPYLTNAPNGNAGAVGAAVAGSSGGYLIYLDDEKLIFRRP
jgi:hypothetical protein